jgi:hypothetical protein
VAVSSEYNLVFVFRDYLRNSNLIGQDRQGDANIFTLCLRKILCFTAALARRTVNGVIVYIP